MNTHFSIIIAIWLLSIAPIYSYSACDDIDIHFLIDTDSIINNGENIQTFIKSIIWNGNSEYSAISIALYGDDMPSRMSSNIIINLAETDSIVQRVQQEHTILGKLEMIFSSITTLTDPAQQTTITISDAFKHSNDQYKPLQISESQRVNEFFIFDFHNKLLQNNDDLCWLLYHDVIINKNIHFMMGKKYKSLHIQCDNINGNVYDDRIDSRTFFNFYHIVMERIYDITCPSNIDIDGMGDLSLGNNVQWIDPKVIIRCDLVEIINDDITAPFELDATKSMIQVLHYNDADNTFKINDYLIVQKDESKILSGLGCWSLIYKIIDITTTDDTKLN